MQQTAPAPAQSENHDGISDGATAGVIADEVGQGAESVNGASGTTGQPDTQPKGTDVDDEQPVVGIIAASNRLLGDLEVLEIPDLSITQKGNLYRALELIADWLANHEEMLQGLRVG